MAQFHTLYTYVAVRAPHEAGPDLPPSDAPRVGAPFRSQWMGRIGEMQFLPTYLGFTGVRP